MKAKVAAIILMKVKILKMAVLIELLITILCWKNFTKVYCGESDMALFMSVTHSLKLELTLKTFR